MEHSEVKSIIEAILFAADRPVTLEQLSSILDINNNIIEQAIRQLQQDYEDTKRSFHIIEIANGFQICTRNKYAQWIKKFFTVEVSSRLSTSALEALAIIAYKQPVTRAEIEKIRGVNSDSVIHSLSEKNLIRVAGRKEAPGRPLMYETTSEFLIHFGLRDLSELPPIDEIEQMLGTPKEEMRSEVRKALS